jgi:hypothetical protein
MIVSSSLSATRLSTILWLAGLSSFILSLFTSYSDLNAIFWLRSYEYIIFFVPMIIAFMDSFMINIFVTEALTFRALMRAPMTGSNFTVVIGIMIFHKFFNQDFAFSSSI